MHDHIGARPLSMLVALAVTGCVSMSSYYVEPELPTERVAVIESASVKESYQRVSVSAIDGKELAAVEGRIRLAPGVHDLKLFISSSSLAILFGEVDLHFDARAQHVYRIGGTIQYGIARVWIADAETQQVIARAALKIANTGDH